MHVKSVEAECPVGVIRRVGCHPRHLTDSQNYEFNIIYPTDIPRRTATNPYTVGDRLTNTFTEDFCVRITNTIKKDFFCLDNEHIFGDDQGDTIEIMDEILTTARDLELEVNEDNIEELIMGHEDELTIEELQEILKEEHQETQRNVSPEQEEDERGSMPTSATKELLKKWEAVRAMVLKLHPNQADVSKVGDLYNNNAINYFRKILKKREKQSTLDMFFNAP
ncbi:uncharacterized protein TNCV_4038541 [Trichonephila clavipes]|nr:uncharacterized protein TNCV_4038541 [Trichonephila clavipes]